jgi:hypothetical protein
MVQSFSPDKGAIRKQWQNFKAQENVLRVRGQPTVLTTEEINEIVDVILNAQITRRHLSGHEVRGIIENKYQRTGLLDTLYQILRQDERVCLCTPVPMEDSQLQVPERAIR